MKNPKSQPGRCPVCGCDLLNYVDTDYDNDGLIGYLYICENKKCRFEGIEWHVSHFDTHTDRYANAIKKG